jgi:hypothetical protein
MNCYFSAWKTGHENAVLVWQAVLFTDKAVNGFSFASQFLTVQINWVVSREHGMSL